MKLIAIIVALALEQWRAFQWRAAADRQFVRYARYLERNFNGGRADQGVIAMIAALLPPVVVAAGVYWLAWGAHPLLALLWNIAVLYLLMGFRRFSHALSAIVEAFRNNDVIAARRTLAAWRGGYTAELSSQDVTKLAIERGLIDAYRQVFAVLLWFAVLPGPAGAVLYRAVMLLAQEWRGGEIGEDETPLARRSSRSALHAAANGPPLRRPPLLHPTKSARQSRIVVRCTRGRVFRRR